MPNQEENKQNTLIILQAVKENSTGKDKLASILRGSKSKRIINDTQKLIPGYGSLFWHDVPTIKGFIKQLEDLGFIKTQIVNGLYYPYPIILLTETGKKALEEKIEIPLQIIKIEKPIMVGESENITFTLFKSGKDINQIAEERNLKPSTIYTHLSRLISTGKLTARECIKEDVISLILKAKKKLNRINSLKQVKEILPDYVTYEEIRCVLQDKSLENET